MGVSQVELSHDMVLEMPFYASSMHDLIRAAQDCMAPVLITGEKGAKKRALARGIHVGGPHRQHQFVAVRGENFVDALQQQMASGRAFNGTIFVNGVERLSPEGQEALEDFLESKSSGVRIIASSEIRLSGLIDQPGFSKSLLHRLSIIHIDVAPLRERTRDIPAIASFLLDKVCRIYRLGTKHLSTKAEQFLVSCPWPGNIDELEGVLARSAANASGGAIDIKDFRFIHSLGDEDEPATGRFDKARERKPPAPGEAAEPLTAKSPAMRLAHEIKNPLVSIKTYADLLEGRIEDPMFRREFYQVMRRDVEKIDRAVANILAEASEPEQITSRPGEAGESRESGGPALRKMKFSLNALIENLLPLHRHDLSRRRVAIFKELSGEASCFQVEEQLKEALERLLSMIIERTAEGGDLHIATTACKFMRRGNAGRSFAELRVQGKPAGDAGLLDGGAPATVHMLARIRNTVIRHGGLLDLNEDGIEGISVTITLPVSP